MVYSPTSSPKNAWIEEEKSDGIEGEAESNEQNTRSKYTAFKIYKTLDFGMTSASPQKKEGT